MTNLRKLTDLSYEEYHSLHKSGMFWEYYPEAFGTFYEDVEKPMMLATIPEIKANDTKYEWTEDGCTSKATIKDNVIKIKAVSGFNCNVNTLLKLTDTGNGLIAKIPSYSSSKQDNYICMDYSEAQDIYRALQVWFDSKK